MGDVIVNITYVRPLALYIRVRSALATSGPSGLVQEDGEMSFLPSSLEPISPVHPSMQLELTRPTPLRWRSETRTVWTKVHAF